MPLINCEDSLVLTWIENCVLTSKSYTRTVPDANPTVAGINNPTGATCKITDTKLYVPIVSLSTQDDNKLLE